MMIKRGSFCYSALVTLHTWHSCCRHGFQDTVSFCIYVLFWELDFVSTNAMARVCVQCIAALYITYSKYVEVLKPIAGCNYSHYSHIAYRYVCLHTCLCPVLTYLQNEQNFNSAHSSPRS